MAINTDKNKIQEILSRGVEEVFVKRHLESQLKSGKKLRIKLGIDPTGPKIHIGRAIVLWKLRAFQDLGHTIILIIGDFTALVGDASDKQDTRKQLTDKEIKENMKNYKSQLGLILNMKKIELRYNSEWLSKMNLKDILELAMHFTAQQMIQRRNFKERWNEAKPIGIHELFYPLLQGVDSVAIKADVELGGFDQLFNLKTGRDIQKINNQEPQDIMVLKMLDGTDGRKMSTSWGNVINITDEPNDMYGKIMSIKDELIEQYFEFCTNLVVNKEEINSNPRNAKAKLAKEIVRIYHNEKEANKAEQEFSKVFKKGGVPDKIKKFKTKQKEYPILDLLKDSSLVKSKAEAKRVVMGGGVSLIIKGKSRVVKDWQEKIMLENGMIIQKGKRGFVKIGI